MTQELQQNTEKIMKKYNYYYYGQPIPKERFLSEVPSDWEEDVNEHGEFLWGGFKAISRD